MHQPVNQFSLEEPTAEGMKDHAATHRWLQNVENIFCYFFFMCAVILRVKQAIQ